MKLILQGNTVIIQVLVLLEELRIYTKTITALTVELGRHKKSFSLGRINFKFSICTKFFDEEFDTIV